MSVRLARASVLLLVAATALQLAVHALYAIGWLRYPDISDTGDVNCVDPPCGPEALPPPEALPVAAPFLLLGLALLLGAILLTVALVHSIRGPQRGLLSGLLLTLAPLLVLAGGELMPHVVTPCWLGEIPGVCERTDEHGIDWAGNIHLLAHGMIGWVPATALALWLLSRWRPEVLPQIRARPEGGSEAEPP